MILSNSTILDFTAFLGSELFGDAKYVWEINRHNFLVTLGQAYWFNGQQRYYRKWREIIYSWIEANPYHRGINWESSLELAFRSINWIWSGYFFREELASDEKLQKKMFETLYLQADHIYHHLSYYFSPNTHLTGEALGILYVGILEKPFEALQRHLFLAFLGILAVAVTIAIMLSYVLSGYLTKSLLGMLHATRNLAKGDLQSPVAVHSTLREVSELTDSFNHMAAQLVQRTKALLGKFPNESLRAIGAEAEHSLAEEIVRLFASGLSGVATNERMQEEPHGYLPKLVQRAEDWLEAEPHRVPRIQELSLCLNVSPRQLYRSFHAEVGMSPAKYLRRYCMTRARFELLAADPRETTVTSVALSWGFWELGRFSVEFRRLFGESPSQTLATVR